MNVYDISDYKDRDLGRVLEWQARTNGQQLWLWSGENKLSFGEAERLVNRYAHGLRGVGVRHGDIVAMVMEPSIEVVLLAMATAKLGATFTTINTDYHGAFLDQALTDTAAAVLIVDESFAARLNELPCIGKVRNIFVHGDPVTVRKSGAQPLTDLLAEQDEPPACEVLRHWRDTVQVWWSSGTTGKSKGVMFCHSHLLFLADLYIKNRTKPDAVLFSCTPMYLGVPWVSIVYPSLLGGVVAAIDPRFSVSQFWERVRYYGATNIHTLGAMHMMLWKQSPSPQDRDNKVRLAFMIPTPHDLVPKFKARWGIEDMPQCYGTSETYMVLEARDDGTTWEGSAIGRPLPHWDIKLVDEEDQEVATGTIGEICARPKMPGTMFSGYFKEPQRTLETLRDLWYHTGDMAIRDEQGVYHFADRKKDYIRYKGRSISNFEVESVVYQHPDVADVAAFGIQSAELASEQELAVYVIPKAGCVIAAEELARFINRNAPYYFVPRYIDFVDSLPRNAHGRTLKNELRDRGLRPNAWDRDGAGFKVER